MEPVIDNSYVDGARVADNSVAKGKIFGDGQKISSGVTRRLLKRDDPNQPVNILINIKGMDISEYVPRYIPTLEGPVRQEVLTMASQLDTNITGYVIYDPNDNLAKEGKPPGSGNVPDNAGFFVSVPEAGRYDLAVAYASSESRPTDIYVNATDGLVKPNFVNRLSATTSGDGPEDVKWFSEATLELQKGRNEINFMVTNGGKIPNLRAFRLIEQLDK